MQRPSKKGKILESFMASSAGSAVSLSTVQEISISKQWSIHSITDRPKDVYMGTVETLKQKGMS